MGLFDIDQDREVTTKLLKSGSKNSMFKFGTGYFNPTADYLDVILNQSNGAKFDVLMAHPKANGFFGSKFPAGGIPPAYTLIANKFFNSVGRLGQHDRIKLFEYLRDGWTFHGKGLWFSPDSGGAPIATMVGSPNFGYRSVERDLESQITIVTTNKDLRNELDEEQKMLFESSTKVTQETFKLPERRIPNWVKVVVATARNLF